MTTEQILAVLFEKVDAIHQAACTTREALPAVSQAVRRLADGLSASERRQQADVRLTQLLEAVQADEKILTQIVETISTLATSIEEIHVQRDPSKMTAEELAAVVDFNTICRARQIIWARSHPDSGWDVANPGTVDKKGRVTGVVEPRPLPPAPHDLVPETVKKKREEENAEQLEHVSEDNRTRFFMYAFLGLAVFFAGLSVFLAWRH